LLAARASVFRIPRKKRAAQGPGPRKPGKQGKPRKPNEANEAKEAKFSRTFGGLLANFSSRRWWIDGKPRDQGKARREATRTW
jgi:hypothetical protein